MATGNEGKWRIGRADYVEETTSRTSDSGIESYEPVECAMDSLNFEWAKNYIEKIEKLQRKINLVENQSHHSVRELQEKLDRFTEKSHTATKTAEELENKNTQLQKTLEKCMEENSKLNQEIESMENFIRHAHKATTEDMKKYLDTIEALDENFKDTCGALDKAHEKIRDDITEINMLIEMNEVAEAENEKLKGKENKLKERVKELKKELQEIGERYHAQMAANSNVFSFWKNNTPNRLSEYQTKVKELQAELKEAYVDKRDSQRKLATMNFELKKCKEFIYRQEKIISSLNAQVHAIDKKSAEEEMMYKSTKSLSKVENITANNSTPEEKDFVQLEEKVIKLQEEKVTLESSLNTLQEMLKEEKRKNLNNVAAAREEVQNVMKEQIEDLTVENEELNSRVNELQRQFNILEKDDERLNVEIAQVEKLKDEIKELAMENEQLIAKMAEHKSAQQNRSAENEKILHAKIENLENSYYFKVEEAIKLNKALNEMQDTVTALTNDRSVLQQKLTEQQKLNKAQQRKLNDLSSQFEKQVAELEKQNKELKKMIHAMKGEKGSHSEVLDRFSKELAQLQMQLNQYTIGASQTDLIFDNRAEPEEVSMQADADVVSTHDSECTTTTTSTINGDGYRSFCSANPAKDERDKLNQRIKKYAANCSFYGPLEEVDSSDAEDHLGLLKVQPSRNHQSNSGDKKKGRVASAHRNCGVDQNGIQKLQGVIEDLKTQIDHVTNSMDVIEFEKDDLELELTRLKNSDTQYYKANLRLHGEIKQLKQELSDSQQRNEELTARKLTLENRVKELESTQSKMNTHFDVQSFGQSLEMNAFREVNEMLNVELSEATSTQSEPARPFQVCPLPHRTTEQVSNKLCEVKSTKYEPATISKVCPQPDRTTEQVSNEIGLSAPSLKVADMVKILEQSELFSRQHSAKESRPKTRTPSKTGSERSKDVEERSGWRDRWANGEVI